jgi:hypothetical protein
MVHNVPFVLYPVHRVNQLPQSSVIAAVEGEGDARQIQMVVVPAANW